MRRLKKIISFMLAIVMIFSCITAVSNVPVKAEEAATWQKEAIISPVEKKLVGAGYIDIKWSNILENVKQYKVYVDGALKKTVTKRRDNECRVLYYESKLA